MKEVKSIIRVSRLQDVLHALHEHPEIPGVTVSHVTGFGRVMGRDGPTGPQFDSVEMCKLECLAPDSLASEIVELIRDRAHTGRPGDGKIAILSVDELVRTRTGERGDDVL